MYLIKKKAGNQSGSKPVTEGQEHQYNPQIY